MRLHRPKIPVSVRDALTHSQWEVISLRFLGLKVPTLATVAQQLGITRSGVSDLELRAMKHIRTLPGRRAQTLLAYIEMKKARGVWVRCGWCGDMVYRNRSVLKRFPISFCNSTCRGKYQRRDSKARVQGLRTPPSS